MIGFRQLQDIASIPYRSNTGGVGFRNDFNRELLTAGPLVTNRVDLSNYVPSYVAPSLSVPEYALVDNEGDNYQGPGNYQDGNSGNFSPLDPAYDDEMGDTNNNSDNASDDTDDSVGGFGGGDINDFGDGDVGYSNGGTIPPMYAQAGLTKQERDRMAILAQQEAAKVPKSTIEFKSPDLTEIPQNINYIKDNIYNGALNDFGGTVDSVSKNAFGKITDQVKNYTDFLENPSKNTFDNALGSVFTLPNIVNTIAGGPPIIGAPLLEGAFDFVNYIGKTYGDESIAKREAYKEYVTDITGGNIFNNPIAAAENAVGDYGIDDTLDPNIGAIPGDYSPTAVEMTTIDPNMGAIPGDYSPPTSNITGTSVYNTNFVPTSYDDFMADVRAELAAIAAETGSVAGNDGGSGWADGGYYNDDGTDFGTNEYSGGPADTGNALDDALSNDLGLSRGGKIYASQGGYVNSTGGK